jgi:uncharacterized protein
MKQLEEIQKIFLAHKKVLKDKYKVKELGIFGSFARGEQRTKSDVDVLVEFNVKPDIFLLIDLEDYLKNLIGTKVDLVRKGTIRDELKNMIEKEAMYI